MPERRPRIRPDEGSLCGLSPAGMPDVFCHHPAGHGDGPHEAEGSWGTVTWEPRYVGDLRREAEDRDRHISSLRYALREAEMALLDVTRTRKTDAWGNAVDRARAALVDVREALDEGEADDA